MLQWIGFTTTHAPLLMKRYFGTEQPIHLAGSGISFPILRLPRPDFGTDAAQPKVLAFRSSNSSPLPIIERQWTDFRDPNGKFVVKLPSRPRKQRGRVPTYRSEVSGESLRFEIIEMDLNSDDADEKLLANPSFVRNVTDVLIKSLLKNIKTSRLSHSSTVELDGRVARDFTLEFWNNLERWQHVVRVVVTKRRMYVAMATSPKNAKYTAARNRFFSSFRVSD